MIVIKARRKDPAAEAALTASQRRFANIIRDATLAIQSQIQADEGKILDALMHRPTQYVIDMIDLSPYYEMQEPLQAELLSDYLDGASRAAKLIPRMRVEKATAWTTFGFDRADNEGSNWAWKNAGNLIQNINASTVQIVRDQVSQAMLGMMDARTVAQNLSPYIGLTVQQSTWVSHHYARQFLAHGDRQRAIDSMHRYSNRIKRYRRENIARTEIMRASNEGRKESWRQAHDQGFIPSGAIQQWSTNFDGRECEECAGFDGAQVMWNEEFSWGGPPVHPSCRCTVNLLDAAGTGLEGLSEAELDQRIEDLLAAPPPPAPVVTPTASINQIEAVAPPGDIPYPPGFGTGATSFHTQREGVKYGKDHYSDSDWGDAVDTQQDLKSSLWEYTGNGFTPMNRHLRGGLLGTDQYLDNHCKNVSRALGIKPLEETLIGTRGLSYYGMSPSFKADLMDLVPGDILHDAGFGSSTLGPFPALGSDVTMRIKMPAGTRGAYVGRFSQFDDGEGEFLIDSGTSMRVVAVHRTPGTDRFTVDLEIIEQTPFSVKPTRTPAVVKTFQSCYNGYMEKNSEVEKKENPVPVLTEFNADGTIKRLGQKFIVPGDSLKVFKAPK